MLKEKKIDIFSKRIIILFCICGSALFLGFNIFPNYSYARAILVFPRLGVALQGPEVLGSNFNGDPSVNFCNERITIWIAPDPPESPVPLAWYDPKLWNVAIVPSALPTANLTILPVEKVISGKSKGTIFGPFSLNNLYDSAVGIVCKVPKYIEPVTYNLIIGFREDISVERQLLGQIKTDPSPGSSQGVRGSANILGTKPFILTEPSCISFPWAFDGRSWDDSGKNIDEENAANNSLSAPFSFIHATDPHFSYEERIMQELYKWRDDMEVLAPTFIAISGDLIDLTYEEPEAFNLTYDFLKSMALPFVITCGNHDQKMLTPWKYFFGATSSIAKFDDLYLLSFDSSLPTPGIEMNWISNVLSNIPNNYPKFLMCHYAPWGDYFNAGWLGITNLALSYGVKGIIVGHYHGDYIAKVEDVQNSLLAESDFISISSGLSIEALNQIREKFDSSFDVTSPIEDPLLILTRSTGKESFLFENKSYSGYSGYRRFVLEKDEVYNFSYDYNNDGIRDIQYSIPNGRFNTVLQFDSGKWTLAIESSLNEDVIGGRALFKVPSATEGYKWDLVDLNKTNGAYIRSYLDDGIQSLIDVRCVIPKNSIISLQIEEVEEDNL
ncbi:MAG: metallophosphoesterase family protein [Promethearchaeota archaeon]